MTKKIQQAKQLISQAINQHKKIAVACSFGKDSMVVVHLARLVDPDIPIFSIMTPYKPKETFTYLKEMNQQMNLNITVYMVADAMPDILLDQNLKIILLPAQNKTHEIYKTDPDECCRLLKVEPTKVAVKELDAWISGLRNTEGNVRKDYQHIEEKGGLMKINPILTFTEQEVLQYLQDNQIPLHPWYTTQFPDGKKYRSLGCQPCTVPISEDQLERDGRWQSTSKCGGECGIHTQQLK